MTEFLFALYLETVSLSLQFNNQNYIHNASQLLRKVTLGNRLVIRALIKASTIPANVKKLFLSLAFSDLAVLGLLLQLMKAIIYAVVWKMASRGDNLASLCPTVLRVYSYFGYLLIAASFLNVTVIAGDRLLAVSLHL